MDRRRAALLAAALICIAAAARTPAPLRALQWLAPDADPVAAMTTAPTECLTGAAGPEDALAVEVGRAAFRSPLLLGGQAARAGLACESCHREGRGNPQFDFPGLSGAPGTADVTSSLMSSHRGDRLDNPRPIPDLSGPKHALKVAQDPGAAALAPFIRGLIVEEFDGAEPPPAVLAGLAAYVRRLDPAACPDAPRRPASAARDLDDARRAVRAARALAVAKDPAAALTMVDAARARLGLIDERYAGLPAERAALAAADRRLAQAAHALRTRPAQAPGELDRWLEASPRLETRLTERQSASLYAPARLRMAVAAPLPGKAP